MDPLLNPPPDPAREQTEASVAAYLTHCQPGDMVAIRATHGGPTRYILTTVEDVNPKLGRLYTSVAPMYGGKAWYRKTGKNCHSPKGKAKLVEPTQAVQDFARAHPLGVWTR